jgi:16S rRNA (uracil1498-N3)-methyltransferase
MLVDPTTLTPGSLIEPDDEELRHLKARRAVAGDEIRLYDGRGTVADGHLVERARRLVISVEAVTEVAAPPRFLLAVGAGDKERFGWLAEKAAELGVTELVPLETTRAMSVATRLRPQHLDALRRRARQAVKQSGAGWAPEILEPASLEAMAGPAPESEVRLLAHVDGGSAPDISPTAPVVVVVGPEGGLTDDEREFLLERGFVAVRLARDLLRFETAALAAAAVVAGQRGRSTR